MEKNDVRQGVIFAGISYLIWGLFPIYWKHLQGVGADEILANRIFGRLFLCVFYLLLLVNGIYFIKPCVPLSIRRNRESCCLLPLSWLAVTGLSIFGL